MNVKTDESFRLSSTCRPTEANSCSSTELDRHSGASHLLSVKRNKLSNGARAAISRLCPNGQLDLLGEAGALKCLVPQLPIDYRDRPGKTFAEGALATATWPFLRATGSILRCASGYLEYIVGRSTELEGTLLVVL